MKELFNKESAHQDTTLFAVFVTLLPAERHPIRLHTINYNTYTMIGFKLSSESRKSQVLKKCS